MYMAKKKTLYNNIFYQLQLMNMVLKKKLQLKMLEEILQ